MSVQPQVHAPPRPRPGRPPRRASSICFRALAPTAIAAVLESHGWQRRHCRHVTEVARLRLGSSIVVCYHTGLIIGLGSNAGAILELLAAVYPALLTAQGGDQ